MNRDEFKIRIEIIKGMEWKMSRMPNAILHLVRFVFEWTHRLRWNYLQHMLHYRI